MSTTTETHTQSRVPITTIETTPSGDTSAKLNFYEPPKYGSKPFNYVSTPPEGQPQSNFGTVVRDVPIHDMRGKESQFNVSTHAFQPLVPSSTNPISKADFTDDETIKSTYYPEVEKVLLENLPGSPNRVLIFDHTIRRAVEGAHRSPVQRTHIDQTSKSTIQRVHFHLPDEAEELLKGRYRIVNVWRPLNGTVESFPLAVAESKTLTDDGLIGVEHRYPDRTGETAAVEFQKGTRWWYWSGMTDDERLLLQCFDSQDGTRVPHTAFEHPATREGAKARESIEVRALVFG